MEQDAIKEHIQLWLSRSVGNGAVKELFEPSIAIGSDKGVVREDNQDRTVCVQVQVTATKSFIIGVLSDGMGGMVAGAECASLSVATFINSCIRNRHTSVVERLIKAVEDANSDVYSKYKSEGGATLSAFIYDSDGKFEAVNVGDSRIYANMADGIKQYSKDDTLAGLYADAEESHLSNRLLQYIGMGPELEPHIVEFPKYKCIKQLVLTSDGAHYIEAGTFKQILNQRLSASELCKRIIHVSKWCGGHDNSSILIVNDLLNILAEPDKTSIPTGTIKLWDSFGEIQFIGVTASPNRIRRAKIETEQVTKKQEETETSKDKVKVKRLRRRTKNKESKENKDEGTIPKPQLRIDFE